MYVCVSFVLSLVVALVRSFASSLLMMSVIHRSSSLGLYFGSLVFLYIFRSLFMVSLFRSFVI